MTSLKMTSWEVIGQGTCTPSLTPGYTGSPRVNAGWGKGVTAATVNTHPFIDAAAFTIPNQTYQIENAPKTAPYGIFGPGGFDLDSSVARSFKLTVKVAFIFKATATNVTNAVHFGISSTTVNPAPVVAGVNSAGIKDKQQLRNYREPS